MFRELREASGESQKAKVEVVSRNGQVVSGVTVVGPVRALPM